MFVLEEFDKTNHDREAFISDNDVLTNYLRKYANQDQRRNLTKVYVAVKKEQEHNSRKIIYGYFSLSAYSLYHGDLVVNKNSGEYKQIPAILIGRLAVRKEQKELRGYELLGRALKECKKVSDHIGTQLVIVEAIDESTVQFYLRQGFIQLKSSPMRLYFPIKAIKQKDNISTREYTSKECKVWQT